MSKEQVNRDTTATIGTKITVNEGRDAIHVAVEPVVAAERLIPGQHIGLTDLGLASQRVPRFIGIVDPFLNEFVSEGDRFWMFVYPRTITSLRHVWTHPDIPNPERRTTNQESMELIDKMASVVGITGEAMIAHATDYLDRGSHVVGGSEMEGHYVPDEFWDQYELVAKRKVSEDERGNFFSCSC